MSRAESVIIGFFESLEHIMVSIAVIISPWLADLVVAGLAVRNVQQILAWPLWLSVLVGAGLEGLGMATAGVALELRRYNAQRGAGDPSAPVGLAWALVILQFLGSVVLALLNTISGLVVWAIVAIPVLGGGGTLAQMLHDDHKKRLADQATRRAQAEHEAELARRRSERQAARAERPEPVRETSERSPRQAAIVRYVAEHPFSSLNEIAEAVGTSKTTVHTELATVGMKKNGNGWEVLT